MLFKYFNMHCYWFKDVCNKFNFLSKPDYLNNTFINDILVDFIAWNY